MTGIAGVPALDKCVNLDHPLGRHPEGCQAAANAARPSRFTVSFAEACTADRRPPEQSLPTEGMIQAASPLGLRPSAEERREHRQPDEVAVAIARGRALCTSEPRGCEWLIKESAKPARPSGAETTVKHGRRRKARRAGAGQRDVRLRDLQSSSMQGSCLYFHAGSFI